MRTLEEFNEARRELYRVEQRNVYNGIACPDCGAELIDSCPQLTLTSNPPQKTTKCLKCTYTGYRIA